MPAEPKGVHPSYWAKTVRDVLTNLNGKTYSSGGRWRVKFRRQVEVAGEVIVTIWRGKQWNVTVISPQGTTDYYRWRRDDQFCDWLSLWE